VKTTDYGFEGNVTSTKYLIIDLLMVCFKYCFKVYVISTEDCDELMTI